MDFQDFQGAEIFHFPPYHLFTKSFVCEGSVSFIEAGTEALQAMHRAHVSLKHPKKHDPGGGLIFFKNNFHPHFLKKFSPLIPGKKSDPI